MDLNSCVFFSDSSEWHYPFFILFFTVVLLRFSNDVCFSLTAILCVSAKRVKEAEENEQPPGGAFPLCLFLVIQPWFCGMFSFAFTPNIQSTMIYWGHLIFKIIRESCLQTFLCQPCCLDFYGFSYSHYFCVHISLQNTYCSHGFHLQDLRELSMRDCWQSSFLFTLILCLIIYPYS